MARPTTKVEIAFDAGVTGAPTWVDITALGKVRVNPGISLNHWRRDEGSTCEPSRLSLTLINNDGRYTPGNAASPHYPNIKKGRRVRVTSTLNGEVFPRFTGYIDDWQAEWPAVVGSISDCRIAGSSMRAYLGRGTELKSIAEETILLDEPSRLYVLGEPAGSIAGYDVSGNNGAPATIAGSDGTVTFGATGILTTSDVTSVALAGGLAQGKHLEIPAAGADTLQILFKRSGVPPSDEPILVAQQGKTAGVGIFLGTGLAAGQLVDGSGTILGGQGADGNLHLLTWRPTTGAVWLDGVAVSSATTIASFDTVAVGGASSAINGTIRPAAVASFSHLMTFGSALPLANVQLQWAAISTGFVNATPAGILTMYAVFAGVSAIDFDAGQLPSFAHVDTTDRTALAAMQQVETDEGGVLFDALDGTLTFHDRAHRYQAAAFGSTLFGGGFFGGGPDGTEFTLSYSAGHIASPIVPVLDDQFQVNDMINTNASGVTGRRYDQSSIDDHGRYRDGLDLNTADPDEPLLRASWMVNRYSEPLTRVSEVEVLLESLDDDLAAVVLQAQVGTIFTLADLPSNAPASKMHLFVEGRSDQITATEDRIIFRTSPAEMFEVFTLDDPARGALGGEYPLGY